MAKEKSIFDALKAAAANSETRFKHGDSVRLPTGRVVLIASKGAEDTHKWADRLGREMAYRVRFEDGTQGQFRADFVDRVGELVAA